MSDHSHNTAIALLDETADYLVVDKPAPLKIHPNVPDGTPTLWSELCDLLAYEIANGGQVSIINRLDRETSGVVLVAKNAASARRFGLAMMERRFRKTYRVIVFGWPSWDEFDLEAPLQRQGEVMPSAIWVKQCVHESGAACRTLFRVLRRLERADGSRFALLEASPITGRMHQIRAHLLHLGLPVVGDKLYGPDEGCYLDFIKTGWTPALASKLLLPRQALHSAKLELEGELAWEAPLPEVFEAFLKG